MTSSEARGPRSIRLLTALLLVATFASGTVTGAALTLWVRPEPHGPPGPPPFGPLPLDELGLSPEQEQRADVIFERHRPELDAILQEGFPKVRKVNDQIESEIREILTPEQRTRLDELKARRPPPRHHHRGGPPGPGGPFPPGPPADGFDGPPPREPPSEKTQ
jgi:Spy/CpxP family protein refolding chaperone